MQVDCNVSYVFCAQMPWCNPRTDSRWHAGIYSDVVGNCAGWSAYNIAFVFTYFIEYVFTYYPTFPRDSPPNKFGGMFSHILTGKRRNISFKVKIALAAACPFSRNNLFGDLRRTFQHAQFTISRQMLNEHMGMSYIGGFLALSA